MDFLKKIDKKLFLFKIYSKTFFKIKINYATIKQN